MLLVHKTFKSYINETNYTSFLWGKNFIVSFFLNLLLMQLNNLAHHFQKGNSSPNDFLHATFICDMCTKHLHCKRVLSVSLAYIFNSLVAFVWWKFWPFSLVFEMGAEVPPPPRSRRRCADLCLVTVSDPVGQTKNWPQTRKGS